MHVDVDGGETTITTDEGNTVRVRKPKRPASDWVIRIALAIPALGGLFEFVGHHCGVGKHIHP